MKKITLLLSSILMTAIGFAQGDFPYDFELNPLTGISTTNSSISVADVVKVNDNGTNTGTPDKVLEREVDGSAQNLHSVLIQPATEFNFAGGAANETISFKVLFTNSGGANQTLRIRVGIGGTADKAQGDVVIPNAASNTWYNATFDIENAGVFTGTVSDKDKAKNLAFDRIYISTTSAESKATGSIIRFDDIVHTSGVLIGVDEDGDNYYTLSNASSEPGYLGVDCDDTDAAINPGATESYYDGIDFDCNGFDFGSDNSGNVISLPFGFEDTDNFHKGIETKTQFEFSVVPTPSKGASTPTGTNSLKIETILDANNHAGTIFIIDSPFAINEVVEFAAAVEGTTATFFDVWLWNNADGFANRVEYRVDLAATETDWNVYQIDTDISGANWISTAGVLPSSFDRVGVYLHKGTNQNGVIVYFDDLQLASTAGIKDFENSGIDFSYFPSPAREVLNLKSAKTIQSIRMYNLLGQEVLSKQINAKTDGINVSGLNRGIYIITATVDDVEGTFKFVKQ
ncbi:T9SS type A sorting domain-containing protein [Tamlana sp. 2201CG12-4]|uniref:T9SS type A sorting domain-containing protein n=1 Tax=Tamlana sp. 2201CG12-4 TaxID=3112582 RepID=UPI002DBBE3DD|nr:T9SS type A sorting domain-containing protein [Tamlana sp. 2201CG12-4]MEC3905733.1 T9SS type A sorting domain-containing protein [Tamlana sp. 2201CG12-4]